MSETMTFERRKAHHRALEMLARTVNCNKPGLTLWRELCRLERTVHAACEAYSSDSSFGLERWETVKNEASAELKRIFDGEIPNCVYINGDPRGHSLKLDCDGTTIPEGMERDWGGNGILAAIID